MTNRHIETAKALLESADSYAFEGRALAALGAIAHSLISIAENLDKQKVDPLIGVPLLDSWGYPVNKEDSWGL